MPPSSSLSITLQTTLALVTRFSEPLSNANSYAYQNSDPKKSTSQADRASEPVPPPLPLLSAAAKSLKAQVTKLSLLTITPPFTPSAVSNILTSLNDSVLPSLITAAHLITPENHTARFHREIALLTQATLKDLAILVGLVEKQSGRKDDADANAKNEVTEATGRVWEGCDTLVDLADKGIAGFVAKSAEEYLALIKDAVKELEAWDPDEEDDDGFDDLEGSEDEEIDDNVVGVKDEEGGDRELEEYRNQALAVLRRVPMSLHVVIKNRLQRGVPKELENRHITVLNSVLEKYQGISNVVDEAAGTLYERDTDRSRRHLREAKDMTVEVVESLLHPLDKMATDANVNGVKADESKEDRYVQKSLDWIKAAGTDEAQVTAVRGAKSKDPG
ncbi:MAG: hypothetical protein Q9160_006563 [Pyrenula sp. 1 TL-2023]